MYEKRILKKEFWNPIRIWNEHFLLKESFPGIISSISPFEKIRFFFVESYNYSSYSSYSEMEVTYIYGCMLLLGFFRTSMLYNRIWDDHVVLTFFYDTVRKVGMCAFILKRISRIILFLENCIFQTMTESPRLLRKIVPVDYCLPIFRLLFFAYTPYPKK